MLEERKPLECEKILQREIQHARIIGLISYTAGDVDQLGRVLGDVIEPREDDQAVAFIRELYPCIFLCFMTWAGALYYNSGNYWSGIERWIPTVRGNAGLQGRLGNLFRQLITRFDLPEFYFDGAFRHIAPILCHGAVPDYCLDEFFQHVVERWIRRELTDPYDPQAVQDELEHRRRDLRRLGVVGEEHLFPYVDRPVWRFLVGGEREAEEFLIQAIRFALKVKTAGTAVPDGPIPERVWQRYLKWHATEKPVSPVPNLREDGCALPVFRFDPVSQEVRIMLPSQDLSVADVGRQRLQFELVARSPAGPSAPMACRTVRAFKSAEDRAQTEPVDLVVPAPAVAYTVRLSAGDRVLREWPAQEGLSRAQPWWAFSERAETLLEGQLPRRPLWLVLARGWQMEAAESGIEETGELYGQWHGHGYYKVNLGTESAPELVGPAGERVPLPVHREAAAEVALTGGDVAPGICSDGHPVYCGELPHLQIAIPPSEPLETWRVEVLAQGDGLPAGRKHHFLDQLNPSRREDGLEIPLADHRLLGPDPLGRFLARVRGPGGVDEQFCVVVAAGLRAVVSPSLSLPCSRADADGPRITLQTPPGLSFEPLDGVNSQTEWLGKTVLKVDPDADAVHGLARGERDGRTATVPIQIQIPRLQWRVQGLGVHACAEWQSWTGQIRIEEWDASAGLRLLVRVPPDVPGPLRLVYNADQQAEQAVRRGEAQFDLARFTDSLRTGPALGEFRLFGDEPEDLGEGVRLFQVRTRFEVRGLTVSWADKGPDRVVTARWEETDAGGPRIVRLWSCQGRSLIATLHTQRARQVDFHRSPAVLPPGSYLIEVDELRAGSSSATPVFPVERSCCTLEFVVQPTDLPVPPPTRPVSSRRPFVSVELKPIPTLTDDLIVYAVQEGKGKEFLFDDGSWRLTPYRDRRGLPINQYLGRAEQVVRNGRETSVRFEDGVIFEYDPEEYEPERVVVTAIRDRERDGACFCTICRRLYWSEADEQREHELQHRSACIVPDRFLARRASDRH